MSLELLQKHASVDDDARSLVDAALGGTARMDQMIAELLAYGQVGGNLRRDDVDLDEVLADVRRDLAGELDGVDLVVADLPVVSGDRTQLRAVLQNLVANAVKFTRPLRSPRVTVSARPAESGWRVEVADNGPGIAPEDRERVLEPMVRGTTRVDGIGLGLAICARVVRAHGGDIGIGEGPDGGACVWLELP
jgi:signal transduction histidine kinase